MGILLGSLAGGVLADAVGPEAHAAAVFATILGGGALVWRRLIDDHGDGGLDDAERGGGRGSALPRVPAVWILGLVILFSFALNGAAIDWSTVLMRQEVGAPVWLWGWPLAALQGVMMVLRFAGDGIRDRFGATTLLRWGGILGAAGFALTGAAGLDAMAGVPMPLRAGLAVAGCAIAGLGMANVIPVALSLAGRLPGVHGGLALSIVSAHGSLGILFMPAVIGWVGGHWGFGATFMALAAFPLTIAALSGVGRTPQVPARA